MGEWQFPGSDKGKKNSILIVHELTAPQGVEGNSSTFHSVQEFSLQVHSQVGSFPRLDGNKELTPHRRQPLRGILSQTELTKSMHWG